MEKMFITVLNMSITGSYVILAVLLMRLLLRRAPGKFSYFLWSAPAFRLCCPVSFEAVFSLFRLRPFDMTAAQSRAAHTLTYIPKNIGMMRTPQFTTGIPAANSLITGSMPDAVITNLSGTPEYSANPLQILMAVGANLWVLGVAVMVLYALISRILLERKLSNAVRMEKNVWQSENVRSPFILGIFRPKIYIPYRMGEEETEIILLHERYHIRWLDHVIRPAGWLILTVHWFNPLVWLAFALMGADMERRCDEWVLTRRSDIKKSYSTSLLAFAANRRFPTPSPLAFGETGVKGRIRNILRWKKPKTWLTVTSLILCAALLLACAANPPDNVFELDEPEQLQQSIFGANYRITDIVYTAAAYSYEPAVDDLPDYRIDYDGRLYALVDADAVGRAAVLTETELTEENFDQRIDTSVWAGQSADANGEVWKHYGLYDSPADVRENNLSAWFAEPTAENPARYAFLRQKDGAYLICIGYGDYIVRIETVEPVGQEGVYRSVRCAYLTPLSSVMPAADSGYLYCLGNSEFSIVHRDSGETVFKIDLADTDGWQEFPYTEEEWAELFLPLGGADYEFVRDGEWLRLGKSWALLKRESGLRIYKIHDRVGIWSAYDLEPGIYAVNTLPETMPEDFAVRAEMWIEPERKNIFDTYDGYIQKDLIRNGVFGKQFEPDREMMEKIYAKLQECSLASVTRDITHMGLYGEDGGHILPNTHFQLYFTADGKDYLILGDSTGLHTDHVMAENTNRFLRYLFSVSEGMQEVMDFPEADGGYM